MGYSLKAIFEWPDEIKNYETLNRLYHMVFQMLGEIFSEHIKYSNPFNIKDERDGIVLRENMMDQFEEPKIYLDLIQEFRQYHWDTDFDSVMSNLFTALNLKQEWKDYRRAIAAR